MPTIKLKNGKLMTFVHPLKFPDVKLIIDPNNSVNHYVTFDFQIPFGKYAGETLSYICDENIAYVKWLLMENKGLHLYFHHSVISRALNHDYRPFLHEEDLAPIYKCKDYDSLATASTGMIYIHPQSNERLLEASINDIKKLLLGE